MCDSKDRYEHLRDLRATGEQPLFEQELMTSMQFSQRDVLKPGDRLWRLSNTGWNGFVSIRKQATAKSYWIRNTALKVSW